VTLLLVAILILVEPTVEDVVKKMTGSAREEEYDDLVLAAATRYRFGPDILRAIIRVESNWVPDIVGITGDVGLAQINPGLAKAYYPGKTLDQLREELKDPAFNLDVAGRFIRELLDHRIAMPELFHAWNVGETKYRKGVLSPYFERYALAYNDYSQASEGGIA
jgi:soluble lytic murein transglycosylase-like protein